MNIDRRKWTKQAIWTENKELRRRLDEFEEIVRAIRAGEVDAFFVNGSVGDCVVTMEGGQSAYRVLVEAMNEGAALIEVNGVFLFSNKALATLLNARLENVTGASLFRFVMPDDTCKVKDLLNEARSTGCASDISLLCEDGTTRPVQLSLSPMTIHGSPRIGLVVTDLTERNKVQELRSLSLNDELTGLLNRRGFMTVGQRALNLAQRLKGPLLLVFADLDGMKIINDTHGHCEGDRALMDTAEILRKTYRDSDIIARMGGDEFTALAMGTSMEAAAVLVRRLQGQIDAHNTRGHRAYHLSISVGVVAFDVNTGETIGDLLARADEAMYANKRRKYKDADRGTLVSRAAMTPACPAIDCTGTIELAKIMQSSLPNGCGRQV